MPLDIAVFVSLTVSIAAILIVIFFVLKGGQKENPLEVAPILASVKEIAGHLERALRDEGDRSRGEARGSAADLREELNKIMHAFQSATSTLLTNMQELQKGQLEVFSGKLTDGVTSIDRRVGGMAGDLKTHNDATSEASERRAQALRSMIDGKLSELKTASGDSDKALREEVMSSMKALGEVLTTNVASFGDAQRERLDIVAKEIGSLTERHQAGQETLRKTIEERLEQLRGDNATKLEQMRQTVDEKLQGTLEQRLGESFKIVSERLEQVHRGLGEMQNLASGVGDLKRVLTNVKTRGTWGEIQLGSLLEQVLTPEQYAKQAQCRPGTSERVEFAVRLPGRGQGEPEVFLPIDAKFPHEDYDRLVQAAERADAEAVEAAARQLEARVTQSARDINEKYINPPYTTDFAILYLPTEGLYAEVLRRPGIVEQVQRVYRVALAGPTTLCATLNALQMGFRTLAIEKRSSEVWQVLEAVKTEFSKYGTVLDKVQKKLQEASTTIEQVAVRKRAIDKRLRDVATMPEAEAVSLLEVSNVLGSVNEEEVLET